MSDQIKKNAKLSSQIEAIIQQKYYPNGSLPYAHCTRGPYDVEDERHLVEVKSCRTTTKNFERNGKQFQRPGRFWINIIAHEELVKLAAEKNKIPMYFFVLYDKGTEITIVAVSMQTWQKINEILSSVPRFTRGDGLVYALIPHTKIFNQTRFAPRTEEDM